MDERRKGYNGGESKEMKETPSKPMGGSQKLALYDKLCYALCTQAGLSAEVIDRIWQDASGNE